MMIDTKLNCRKAAPLIWERAAGDLEPEPAAALQAHLEGCAHCREEDRRARRAFELLAAVDQPVELRTDGWDRLYRRITAPVAPLWRRVTAPALTSAAVAAATLLLAFGQVVNVSPGPRGVVVQVRDAQPTLSPQVAVMDSDGTIVTTPSQGGDLTPGLRVRPVAVAPTPAPEPVTVVDRTHKGNGTRSASGYAGWSHPSAAVVVTANKWNGSSPEPAPRSVRPVAAPAVHYAVDPYTGDIIGRPVGDAGA
jgi:hypothetical protein